MDLRNILNDGPVAPPPNNVRQSSLTESPRSAIPITPTSDSRKRSFGSMANGHITPVQQTPTIPHAYPPPPLDELQHQQRIERPTPRARKRARFTEVPVFAHRFDRSREKNLPQAAIKKTESAPVAQQQREPVQSAPGAGAIGTETAHTNGDRHNSIPNPNSTAMAIHPPPQVVANTSLAQELPSNMEPSFDAMIPFNDITKAVADSIYMQIIEPNLELDANSHWEIEGKLGIIVDQDTDTRLHLPIRTEALLVGQGYGGRRTKFVSMMTMMQHKYLNEYLNSEYRRSNHQPDRAKMSYMHTKETDSFYDLPPAFLAQLPEAAQWARDKKPHMVPRVRVTKNAKTGEVLATIIKFRIEDLDFTNPAMSFDYRVSISLEYNYPFPYENLIPSAQKSNRTKDRMSYKHQHCTMDLTQVTESSPDGAPPAGPGRTSHEMEVELDAQLIVEEGRKALQQMDNEYLGRIQVFMNNIRALSRSDMGLPPGRPMG